MASDTIFQTIPIEIWIVGIFLITALLVGLIIERVIYPYLHKGAQLRRQKNPRIILKSLQGETILWLIIIGIYGGVSFLNIDNIIKNYIFQGLTIILILSIAWFVGNSLSQFIDYYTRKGILPKTSIFNNLTKLIIVLVAAIAILNTFGVSVSPIIAALGVGGIAIALALQPTLANLFSGIAILSARQINPGDYVKLASGEEGFVSDVNWRNTTIKSLDDAMVIVPNSTLDSLIVTNYSLPITEVNLRVPVGVNYKSDLNHVEDVSIEVAKEVMNEIPGGVPNFEPYIRYEEFGDSAIRFKIVLRIKTYADLRVIRHELIKRLHTRFNSEGINIPFPIRTVFMGDDKTKEDIESLKPQEREELI